MYPVNRVNLASEATLSLTEHNMDFLTEYKKKSSLNFEVPNISEKQSVENTKLNLRTDKIACIGAGYVGGPTMAVIAYKCPNVQVTVVDISETLILQWNSDKLPIYEPGLSDIVKACRGKNLFFSTDVAGAIRDSDVIFICVNTPTKLYGIGKGMAADLTAWEAASRSIAKYSKSSKIVIEKSTVPVRTAEFLSQVLHASAAARSVRFLVLSNPEFLAEGTAIKNLLNPDRVLIGGDSESESGRYAIKVLCDIYYRWVPPEKVLCSNVWSSELAKLVANALLAQRVSSINAVSMICDKTGADVRQISKAIGADSRIGSEFLNASVGFGGSCFEKDILSLAYICEFFDLPEAASYWRAIVDMNDLQKSRFCAKIFRGLFQTVQNKKICILGFSFKKNTADIRCSPALDVCKSLLQDGAIINMHDPCVVREAVCHEYAKYDPDVNDYLKNQFFVFKHPREAVEGTHAIVVLTEWDIFKTYDYQDFFNIMMKPAFIFDGRNILDHHKLLEIGFEVHGIGIPRR